MQLGCNLESVLLKVLCYYKLCEVLGGGLDSIAKRRHRVQLGVHEINVNVILKFQRKSTYPVKHLIMLYLTVSGNSPLLGKAVSSTEKAPPQ